MFHACVVGFNVTENLKIMLVFVATKQGLNNRYVDRSSLICVFGKRLHGMGESSTEYRLGHMAFVLWYLLYTTPYVPTTPTTIRALLMIGLTSRVSRLD